jgi:hypothetical protein
MYKDRDPWFPILLFVPALLCIWLGIIGPLPAGVADWLKTWQTLLGASVAVIAAYIAVRNTTRTLSLTQTLETHRRQRKHAALRATLPLALSQIGAYGEETAKALQNLISKCHNERLRTGEITDAILRPVPSEGLKSLAEFIEYSDTVDIRVLANTLALIQIHDSRLRSMLRDNTDPGATRIVTRSNIEESIVDGATIYAGGMSAFGYGWPD